MAGSKTWPLPSPPTPWISHRAPGSNATGTRTAKNPPTASITIGTLDQRTPLTLYVIGTNEAPRGALLSRWTPYHGSALRVIRRTGTPQSGNETGNGSGSPGPAGATSRLKIFKKFCASAVPVSA